MGKTLQDKHIGDQGRDFKESPCFGLGTKSPYASKTPNLRGKVTHHDKRPQGQIALPNTTNCISAQPTATKEPASNSEIHQDHSLVLNLVKRLEMSQIPGKTINTLAKVQKIELYRYLKQHASILLNENDNKSVMKYFADP